MTTYKLNDKITFGKMKGETIADIYKFAPDYLLWLIKYVDDFYINITEFSDLEKPTPYDNSRKVNGIKCLVQLNNVQYGKEQIAKGEIIESIEFSWPEETITILEKKRLGEYLAPKIPPYRPISDFF